MGLVQTAVLEIELEEGGPDDGRPVVLLHGWPDAPRGWRPVAERLRRRGWRTLIPALRGSGATRFRSPDTPRDGRGIALARDAVDLLDALGLDRVPVVGHDWGARAAYTLAAIAPERVDAIVALALPYQPRGLFTIPPFEQARAFWYQWLMYLDAGAEAVRAGRSPSRACSGTPGARLAGLMTASLGNRPKLHESRARTASTLNAYRSRFLADEPRDARYEPLARRLSEVECIETPTLMIQGAADRCDGPAASAHLERYFTRGYRRVLLDGVGHFPHREAPDVVAQAIHRHLSATPE